MPTGAWRKNAILVVVGVFLVASGCTHQAAAPPVTEVPIASPWSCPEPQTATPWFTSTPLLATETETLAPPEETPTLPPGSAPTETTEPTAPPDLTPQPGLTSSPALLPNPTATPRAHVTVRVGWLRVPQALDTSATGFDKADLVLSWIYDRLIDRKLDNTYVPSVARSWFSADDGKTWLFALEPGIRTHSGETLTGQDVAFSLSLFQGHFKILYNSGYTITLQNIEATEPNTLTVTLTHPSANIEALLHWIPVLPRRSYESVEYAGGQRIGSGPFVLTGFEPGQAITLTANMGYWQDPPRVDGIVVHSYPDAGNLVQALLDGSVDVISDVPPHLIATLKAHATIQVVSGPQVQFRALLFNVSNREQSTGHPALRDKRVRLAIAQAIDKQQLIDMILVGRGMPGLSVVPPVLGTWFNSSLKDAPFDLATARSTLEDAGYQDSDNDGVREMPDGTRPLSLRLYAPSDLDGAYQAAEMIANWLAQVGIEATVSRMDSLALTAACNPSFDYDMALCQNNGGPEPGFLLSTLTSDQIGLGLNWTGYSNPDYDALYHEQALTLDPSERREMIWQLQRIAFDDRPCVVLHYDLAVEAFRKDRLRNWLFLPNGVLSLLDKRSLLQVEPALQ